MKKLSLFLVFCLLLTMPTLGYAKNNNDLNLDLLKKAPISAPEKTEFYIDVSKEKVKKDTGEDVVTPSGYVPWPLVGESHMYLSGNQVIAWASSWVLGGLAMDELAVQSWESVYSGGRWAVWSFKPEIQFNTWFVEAHHNALSYNSSYKYKVDSYHLVTNDGVSNASWTADTKL